MTGIISKVYLGLPTSPTEKIVNGGFETAGAGGADVFGTWTEVVPALVELQTNGDLELVVGNNFTDWTEYESGTGTVEDEAVVVHGGNHAAKISGGNAYAEMYQSYTVAIGETHTMGVWVKGDWWIWLSEGAFPNYTDKSGTAADWTYVEVSRTQTTTTTMYAVVVADTGDVAYYDDIKVWMNTGAIADEGTIVHGGSHAAKITFAGDATQPYLHQSYVSTPAARNKLSFWSKGDGTHAVAYEIYDVTNAAVIDTGSGTAADEWQGSSVQFWVPAACVSVRITFTGDQDGIVYLDDVSVLQYGAVAWTLSGDVLASPAPRWEYGILGAGPYDLIASTGTASLVFDNYTLPGKYSPGHANVIGGFEEGMPVKITTQVDFAISITGDVLLNGGFET